MKKKAAIELSANFLVVVIISIIVLVLSFALFGNVLNKSRQTTKVLDDRIKQQIENLLMNSGERVVLPINRQEASAGDIVVFGLGITNVLGKDEYFYADVQCSTYLDTENKQNSCANVEVKGLDITKNVQIKNTKRKILEIVLDFDDYAAQGTYIFNVNVCYDDGDIVSSDPECSGTGFSDLYGRKYKIYVEIK